MTTPLVRDQPAKQVLLKLPQQFPRTSASTGWPAPAPNEVLAAPAAVPTTSAPIGGAHVNQRHKYAVAPFSRRYVRLRTDGLPAPRGTQLRYVTHRFTSSVHFTTKSSAAYSQLISTACRNIAHRYQSHPDKCGSLSAPLGTMTCTWGLGAKPGTIRTAGGCARMVIVRCVRPAGDCVASAWVAWGLAS